MPTKRQSTASTKGRSTAAKPKRTAKSAGAAKSSAHRPATKAAKSRSTSQHLSRTTTDHEEIRRWAEDRGAHPACVRRTGGKGDVGMIRLDFPGFSGEESLQPITWEEFFDAFDRNQLALVYQEKTARGQKSNFNKLVSRAGEE